MTQAGDGGGGRVETSGAAAERGRIEIPGANVERVHAPATIEAMQALLSDYHARGEGVLICGGRTRLAQANPAKKLGSAISLEALAGVDVFEPDEGVVHARAGTQIQALRRLVEAEGWELPLDPPGAAATVGGTIASAATGPRAQAFGRVADAVLGLEVVAADGTLSKCGGRVVKNVTGYDLAKLYTGSFGSLAVVVGAWLRLRPQAARRVVLGGKIAGDRETFASVLAASRATSLRACVWSEAAGAKEAELLVELAAGEAAVDYDARALRSTFGLVEVVADGSAALGGSIPFDPIDAVRDERAHADCTAELGFRARVLPARLDELRRACLEAGLSVSIDPGPSVVCARGALPDAESLRRLRAQAEASGGQLACEWLPEPWQGGIDVFGEAPGTRALAAALKQRFDPRGVLNPGRFVVES